MKRQECERLTLSLGGSPVNPSPLPGSEEARRMTVTSGRKCLELYRNSGPLGLLVRMLLESSIWRSTRCSLTWKAKVTPRGRWYYQLAASTPRTEDTALQLWATPNTMDYLPQRSPEALLRQAETSREGRKRPANLREQVCAETVRLWPTPRAADSKGTGSAGSKSADHDLKKHNLKGVVMFYPTPTTGAGLCGGTGNFQQLKKLQQAGQISEEERRNMSQGNGGQLNPTWVEALMGFPVGWTELED